MNNKNLKTFGHNKFTNSEFIKIVLKQIEDGTLEPETDDKGQLVFKTGFYETVQSEIQAAPDYNFNRPNELPDHWDFIPHHHPDYLRLCPYDEDMTGDSPLFVDQHGNVIYERMVEEGCCKYGVHHINGDETFCFTLDQAIEAAGKIK